MSFRIPSRDRLRRALRAGVVALPAVLLAACAASPPPGSLPAPEAPDAASEVRPAAPSALWTILLHAGEDPVVAEEAASRARERFDGPVSVVDEAGEYHVELGEFATEADARAFLGVARERGFPGASVRPLPRSAATPPPSAPSP